MSEILTVSMIDDVLIFSKKQEEHDKHLAVAFGKIQKAGLTSNIERCQFSKSRITLLSQIIDGSRVHPDPHMVSAIRKIGTPENVSDIWHFLGMYNQLSKSVPNLADETKPLRDFLRKHCPWTWEHSQQDALKKLKRLLSSTPVLALYDPNAKTTVSADATSHGLGAVLLQEQVNGDVKPVSYISRLLFLTEEWYAEIEKEALVSLGIVNTFQTFWLV